MASNIATNHKVPYAHYFFYRSASEDRASFAKLFKIGQNLTMRMSWYMYKMQHHVLCSILIQGLPTQNVFLKINLE